MDLVNDFNPKRQLVNPRPVTRPTLPCRLANPRSAADWSVLRPLRDAQHRAADWSTPPTYPHPVWPPLATAAAQPTKATQPTGSPSPPAGAPPKGSPCGTTGQPAGCLAWAIPPGRGSRPPPHGQAQCTAGPETPPCRRRAPALTLRACQPPAVPTAHPPPVRERRAPCPVRLAQSCLSTYSGTSFTSKIAKVV